ncbi:MAG: crotonyl-CoA carboxylase/reductase [Rickettsiales bacterium]|nr:crotonyl-CoA carboxylase/reductase [Rickettsiales bacterium]
MTIKKIYDIGEIPPIGVIPDKMYAWVIRKDREGLPEQAMQIEEMPVIKPSANEVMVMVMAAGVNYNNVWASQGKPVSVMDVSKKDYHIGGSDASGVVWAIGENVKRWKVGDEVIIHCNRDDNDDEECNGGEPMFSKSQKIWGYETADGSFAQFTTVQDRQLLKKPIHLSWEESGCYTLTLATSYRMLFGHSPHTIKPGMNVLVWGASGGIGSMAVQLCRAVGANAIGVVSNDDKIDFVMGLGAKGVLNRKKYDCFGKLPDVNDQKGYIDYIKRCRVLGKDIWNLTEKNDVDIVFEHPGESTFPVSCYLVKRGGMVVICAGTSGYNLTMDARFVWMRQKRIQGSHFANLFQANEANKMVINKQIDPLMSECFEWKDIAKAHTKMMENKHQPGNMAVLVQAHKKGMKNLNDLK